MSRNSGRAAGEAGGPRPGLTAAVLWLLLFLFCLRVLGQASVAFLGVAFLPPMAAWYSGLVSYPWLLSGQIVIILVFTAVCLDFTRGRGVFVQPRAAVGLVCPALGAFYLGVMVTRYAIRMSLFPDERWTGGSIPTFFHWVLAAFILVFGSHHWISGRTAERAVPPVAFTTWPARVLSSLVVLAALALMVWLGSRMAPLPAPL